VAAPPCTPRPTAGRPLLPSCLAAAAGANGAMIQGLQFEGSQPQQPGRMHCSTAVGVPLILLQWHACLQASKAISGRCRRWPVDWATCSRKFPTRRPCEHWTASPPAL
jgi:hypothetical protein